ncbi:integrase core domain-containing protein [Nocardia tengchongensis]
MISNPISELLIDLTITRCHSRPHVSDDNPYSEANFKTLKCCPAFPERFASIREAQRFCQAFFPYYDNHHRHSAIGLHTPATVHDGN